MRSRSDLERSAAATIHGRAACIVLAAGALCASAATAQTSVSAPPDVRIDLAAADAVLAIAERHVRGEAIDAGQWEHLFGTDGYVRLARRERSMGRAFDDATFRAFVLGLDRARSDSLAAAIARWRSIDTAPAAARALRYLPAGTKLRATIYPSIKPASNSFVFELDTDPAIFFYIDPSIGAAKLENTLAHELHHVGQSAACSASEGDGSGGAAPGVRLARRLLGAFGEGVATLAAAGGPAVHPHEHSTPAERARWESDAARWREDLARVESFLLDLARGRIPESEAMERARPFWGDAQGAWYTVGYRMAVEVERAFGRDAVVAAVCDPLRLLVDYDRVAERQGLPRWSEELIGMLERPVPRGG